MTAEDRLHVLIIPSEHFVTPKRPLAGIFQKHQADALHRGGHQVGVIAPGIASLRYLIKGYPYPALDRSGGYPVLRRYVRRAIPERWRRPESRIPLHVSLGKDLYNRYVQQYGTPDVLHAHNMKFAGLVAQSLSAETGVPYVVTEHSSEFFRTKRPPLPAELLVECIAHASSVTAVSSALSRRIAGILDVDGIGVLPNVVDPFIAEKPLQRVPDRDSGATFLNIAGLNQNKNHQLLIEAFADRFSGQPARLRIAGSGPLGSELKSLVASLGVNDQVHFLGYLDRNAVVRELQNAHAVVLTSHHETFGVVLIEALATGRFVISTRCGGPEDFVTDEVGCLVNDSDKDTLGAAMLEVARDPDRYSAERLRAYALDRFGGEAFVQRALELYRGALIS